MEINSKKFYLIVVKFFSQYYQQLWSVFVDVMRTQRVADIPARSMVNTQLGLIESRLVAGLPFFMPVRLLLVRCI